MAGEKRVCLISLGCAKNLVDSEHMLGLLAERGLLPVPDIESAQIAVVNTCGFVQPAVEEALETILEMTELKKKGRLEKVLVAGCLVQRYGRKLRAEMPEVDGWLGTGELPRIVDLAGGRSKEGPPAPLHISRPTYLADHQAPRIQSTPFYSAYLKIAEGCSHRCSFCIIPRLRGAFRSRPPESLLAEAGSLARRGVKELNLVAQDTTAYGADLHPPASLETLLEQLLAIPGLGWLRVLYCHPERVSDRLLALLESPRAALPLPRPAHPAHQRPPAQGHGPRGGRAGRARAAGAHPGARAAYQPAHDPHGGVSGRDRKHVPGTLRLCPAGGIRAPGGFCLQPGTRRGRRPAEAAGGPAGGRGAARHPDEAPGRDLAGGSTAA